MVKNAQELSQEQRFRSTNPQLVANGVELGTFENCTIYNVSVPETFMMGAHQHLNEITEGEFVKTADDAAKTLSALAEFIVWHLTIRVLERFEEVYARNGQRDMWFGKGSPNDIDIIALKKIDNLWRFYAVEIKWSEKCDYYGQLRGGLVEDLKKLYRNEYAHHRLGTHITSLKAQLRHCMPREEIERIFQDIDAGTSPETAKGISYEGVFVSDWNSSEKYKHHDPDIHFKELIIAATQDQWAVNSVSGFMVNLRSAEDWLKKLAMGECV